MKLRRALAPLFCWVVLCLVACAASERAPAEPRVAELRENARGSRNPEVVARWLLGELISPGGDAAQARRARAVLDGLRGEGMLTHLARGLDDSVHGALRSAAEHYLRAVRAARDTHDPDAPIVAWFAASQAVSLHQNQPALFERWKGFLQAAIAEPRQIGWRARAELVDFWQGEAWSDAQKDVLEQGARLHGCARNVRVAGPFGRNTPLDTTRSFGAEAPGPWPRRFEPAPGVGIAPELRQTERDGCQVRVKEAPAPGIYYFETYFDLPAERDVLVAVQGAYAIWVDDHRVLDRDLRQWGSWPRFGVALQLGPGRHRVLARVGEASSSLRLLRADGRPLDVETSDDASLPYGLAAPRPLPDANVLDPYLAGGRLRDPGSDVRRFLLAWLCNVESQPDVANVMLEPLLQRPEHASGPALSVAASFSEGDPIFSDSQRRDLVRELHERAVKRDPGLWQSRLVLALSYEEREGKPEAVREVKRLVNEFPRVPAVLSELARLYAELDWKPEYAETVLTLARRFPDDPNALEPAVGLHDEQGRGAEADALAATIQKLDPDREIQLGRALERQDYDAALAELKRLGRRRPQRKDVAERIHDVMVRAGNRAETWKKLSVAVEKDPKDPQARLALADGDYAAGKRDALARALLDAVEAGAPSERLEDALDLVEGATELEPYRLDGRTIVAEYERAGKELPGTGARVLDYATLWIHADGSSRMLEHEIVRIQSAEAVTAMAEQNVGSGLLLHARVIKKDGRVLEPELVEGKPTLTMPHLEVGDYLETERIESTPGDGQRGERFVGPRWYFREENIAYARSEFVVIAPKNKPLAIETRNRVPAPDVREDGALVVRRWRVEHSPAAPVEPLGAPVVEFLPSVQVGWGVSQERTLEAMADSAADVSPNDPRIVRVASGIVRGVPASASLERAQRLYRWLVTNVEEGEESDGRRVILGRNGNLWRGYITLCRALDIRVDYVAAQSRLTLPPLGPFSGASQFTLPLLRVTAGRGDVWLTLGSKYAPFGYVPADARGMPAYVLGSGNPEPVKVPSDGVTDQIVYEGDLRLASDGSAEVDLVQSMHGKYATALRGAFAEIPEQQIRDVIESRLIGAALRGARLEKHAILHLDEPDKPLVIRTTSRVPSFAQVTGKLLTVTPPFMPRIGQLAALPVRQTPLLLADSTTQRFVLRLHLPPGATLAGKPLSSALRDDARNVEIRDRQEGAALVLERSVVLPAGRVQPNAYPAFLSFVRAADDALSASVRVRLGG